MTPPEEPRAMQRSIIPLLAAAVLALTALGCAGDRVEDSAGTVILAVSEFDGRPFAVSVNDPNQLPDGILVIGSVTLDNIPKNQNANTSQLQDIELTSYEVVYDRVDSGTRVPTPLVRRIFGIVPVGGSEQRTNLVILSAEQTGNAPLSDLSFFNGGIDSETGSRVITLGFRMRFFGRTIAGDQVASAPVRFDIQFTP